MSKTFYAKTANMNADSCDDLILDAAEILDVELTREEITDDMRQKYVDISYSADLVVDSISYGEDYYARNVNKRIVAYLIEKYGK